MTQVNIKMLKDNNNEVFLPFSTTDAVFEADSDKTLKDILTEQTAEIEEVAGDIPTNVSDLTNDAGYIDKDVNDLTNYTLSTGTGSVIDLSLNSSTYVLTLDLKNSAGTVLSTDTVDLPIESMVVNASYDSTNKKIVLTLQSGSTIDVPVADLVAGLQSEITSSNKLSSDLVDDTNKTNKFVTAADKTAWNAKYDKPGTGIPKTDLADAVQTSLGKADTALQSYTETDPVFSASAAADITATDISNWNNKVDKENGKGLSTNDYTTAEQTKLADIESGAEVNIIETVKVNGTALTPDQDRAVNITVAGSADNISYTNTTSGLTADDVQEAIDELASEKVDKVSGKGLSTEDYTTNEKNKLAGIETGAQVNVIENIKVNSTLVPVGQKTASITVPTKTSDLTNDSGFITKNVDDLANYTKTSSLATVATSGSYSDLSGKPTKVSDFTNDSGFITGISSSDVTTALGFTPMNSALKGANSGVAELDATGKIPSSQLPSYVDDVIEVDDYASLPSTGEAGKIYITKDTNKTYRWSGSAYVEISESLALGETSSTAYRGDRGKTAYDHSQAAHAPSNAEHNTIETISLNGTALTPDANRNVALTNIATTSDIPTVNNATLTIKKNSSSVGTFTANASSNVDIDITVPTKTSDLTNDSNFVTSSDLPYKDYSASRQYVTMSDGVYKVTVNNLTISYYDACVDQYGGQEYHQDITLTKGDIITIVHRSNSYQDWGTSQSVGDVIKITGSINKKYVLKDITSPSTLFGDGWSDYNFSIEEIEVSKTSDLVNDSLQPTLISGTNIKTVNNESLLGSGNITVTPDMSNYLAKDNTTAFTPTGDYQPATKKYVDDNAGGGSSDAKDITCLFGNSNKWDTISWNGYTNIYGDYVWTDGDNIYYSYSSGNINKVLDKTTNTWSNKSWSGFAGCDGNYVWTDGTDIYYSNGSTQKVLDKSTSTWSNKTWNGITSINAANIWTDGENIYYSRGGSQYILNVSTSTWSQKSWSGLASFYGGRVWTDGDNIYYSQATNQYVLDKSTSTWSAKVWSGLTSFDGSYVWTDGTNTYYSSSSTQYVLDKSTSTWVEKIWDSLTNLNGSNVWTYEGDFYYSGGTASSQYILNKKRQNVQYAIDNVVTKDEFNNSWQASNISCYFGPLGNWNSYSFGTSIFGLYIWTDGDNIYYSSSSTQKVLDKSTGTWSDKTWTGLTGFTGNYVWTDGTNYYYSNSSSQQYILDKATSTWSAKTWTGLTDFRGDHIWSDGTNIYYSAASNQYVLNKATSTWSEKTWNEYSPGDGKYIWSDGTNIYYSAASNQYVLDSETNSWYTKTWTGLTSFTGNNVWMEGINIYYSYNGTNKVLNKATSTWSDKVWTGYTKTYGEQTWTDGENIYYTDGNTQYILGPGLINIQEALDIITKNMNYAKNLYTNPSDTSDKNI